MTIAALLAALASIWLLPLADWLEAASHFARANPVAGGLIYVAVFAVTAVLLIPGSLLAMCAGYIYGLETGAALATLGGAAGAAVAFLNARTLARSWAETRMRSRPELVALDNALRGESFLIVLLSRLSLLIPYNLLNYFYGITSVRTLPYIVASTIGLIPAMTFYTYVGAMASDVRALIAGDVETGLAGRVYFVVGLIAAILVIIVVHKIATRALRSRMAG